jgi:PAS domain S-box-containing protein
MLPGGIAVAAFEAMPDCVRILSLDGLIEYVNPAALAAVDAEGLERLRGVYWPANWPEHERPVLEQAMNEARAGRSAQFRGTAISFMGARRTWDTTVSPVRDAQGEVGKLLVISRDVSLSVEAEAFFNTLVHLLPNPLLVKNASDSRYVLINRAAEEIFGLSAADAVGKTALDLFPETEARLFADEDAHVIRTRETVVSEEEAVTLPSGEVRHFTTKKLATFEGDSPVHLVVMGEDVTHQRAAAASLKAALAEAEAATQAKSAFLANMSHEIRTPLNGVIGVADLLGRSGLDANQLELVEIIRECGATLNRMLMDVLDLSKIEAGKLTLSPEPFHLGKLTRSVVGLMRPTAEDKGLSFHCEIDPAADRAVTGDPVRLRQILCNLLSNAIKFTDSGTVTLRIMGAGPERFVFEVEDTGIGFDETVKRRLFGRFQQADDSINRRFGGTGLGLAISRQLASTMGGELDCVSAPGQGARFTLVLPLGAIHETPAAPETPADAEGDDASRSDLRLKVLVADDHAVNRKVAELTLQSVGATAYLANDGEAAVQLFREQPFDLVLMDMNMPRMDGLAATRAIRSLEAAEGRTSVPIVMLTGNTSDAHVAEAMAAGADAHLSKPLQPAALVSTILQLTSAMPDEVTRGAANG